MGDFNFRLKEIGKSLNQEGLRESIPEGVGTHSKGNQLDQVLSNAETVQWEFDQLRFIDHKMALVRLKIKYQDNDLKMTDKERTVRITEVRKQCWKTFTDKGKKMSSEDLKLPIRRCFEDKLEQSKNLYQKPPQWAVRCRSIGGNGVYLGAKEQWNEAIRDIEHYLGRNDLKGFFCLLKRLTKNKKQAEPIKGLMINGQRVQPGEQTRKQISDFINKLDRDDKKQGTITQIQGDINMIEKESDQKFWEITEVYDSIQQCKFNIAIRQDGFDGKILAKSGLIRENCESNDCRLDEFRKNFPVSKGSQIKTIKQKLRRTIS
ncbi:hypothetical protein OXYTRIMIC_265 [Oxytricha trifallax]|uniref:Endonuclease/exonuclease/phosphatase domain-containing protein n=1 Tax=Oxytricha trifallax TaxID=1172189 RepID=A0A073I0I3_9SPIT|nr:hypothetical protein OXYTRIMIC_265 [Oxytricha trifallax]